MSEPYRKELLQVDTIHQVYFACYGNKNGKPLFVFHGGPGYGFTDDMLEPFDLNEWNIIAIDQRGCGNSIPLGCIEENRTDLLVDDVKQIADYLGIQHFLSKESLGEQL